MLQTLRIRNYALIDNLEIEFSPGLNVLTGETGAGKSIVVGALNLVLGARASAAAVRTGAKRAEVEAVFLTNKANARLQRLLDEHSIETDDGDLILSRVVSAEGRSKAYAGGRLVPLAVLAVIGDELVDLHGQHDHQSLLKSDRQLALLDAFAELEKSRTDIARQVRRLRDVETQIGALESAGREEVRRIEFLKYEADEIDQAELREGEEEELLERRTFLANAERIVGAASQARAYLIDSDDGASAADRLATALSALEDLTGVNETLAEIASRLEACASEIDTLAQDLLPFTEAEEFDPKELDTLNGRLDALRALKRKYGDSIGEVLAYRKQIGEEIDALDNREHLLDDLHRERRKLEDECQRAAQALSKKRAKAAKRLNDRITESLQNLGMKGAAFECELHPVALNLNGVDQVEFKLAANPGEPLKPLKQVASGGEISRIMLALKSVFADADDVPTLIFDEIDAGIGGVVATKVAERLRDLATSRQTLCITHLAQIAAAGQTHYHVSKRTRNGKTTTCIDAVDARARIEEVARLLDGSVTDLSIDHAEDLLRKLAG